jgi:CBS domain-containing protein
MYDFIYYQVRDVMTTSVVAITEQTPLKEVGRIFQENDFNGLPVLNDDGRLIGMVTKLDFLKAFVFTDKVKVPPYDAIMERSAGRIMTTDLRFTDPEMPLTRVINRMVETKYKSLPVLDNDSLVGMVAREDILSALRRAAEGQLPERMAQD